MPRAGLLIQVAPEDFVVEEALRIQPGRTGDYAVYRATKRLLTTLELQERIARDLGLSPRAVVFPALKDKVALATQHFTVHGRGPRRLAGDGFTAQFIGRWPRHLSPRDLKGNRFTITIRDLGAGEALALQERWSELSQYGLPNYFDEQRFGSYTPGGVFFGKAVFQRDAESALRTYFTQVLPADPPALRAFKASASERWRDWSALFAQAPRSNFRSVLAFLKDHPDDFRKALNLMTPRLLPLLLATYQSYLWNRIASRYLKQRLDTAGVPAASITVAGDRLTLYRSLPSGLGSDLRSLALPLPHHQAAFGDPGVQDVADTVLAEEGLAWNDLKARILTRAYLPKGSRTLLLFPQEAKARAEAGASPGREAVSLTFFLPPGAYATLVLKALAADIV